MSFCLKFERETRSNCCEIEYCTITLQFFAEILLQPSLTAWFPLKPGTMRRVIWWRVWLHARCKQDFSTYPWEKKQRTGSVTSFFLFVIYTQRCKLHKETNGTFEEAETH